GHQGHAHGHQGG
nr:Chain C, SLC39A5 mutant peptide [Homo sapiens]7YF4_D Chain D, SLC39A5 mutant peptide [Homo sapiens]